MPRARAKAQPAWSHGECHARSYTPSSQPNLGQDGNGRINADWSRSLLPLVRNRGPRPPVCLARAGLGPIADLALFPGRVGGRIHKLVSMNAWRQAHLVPAGYMPSLGRHGSSQFITFSRDAAIGRTTDLNQDRHSDSKPRRSETSRSKQYFRESGGLAVYSSIRLTEEPYFK